MISNNKYLFILNPNAGKGNGKKILPQLRQEISKYTSNYELVTTDYPSHARLFAKDLQPKFENIIAVGGDGTINEVINGLDLNMVNTFGVVPVGSGNDFSFSLKLKKTLKENIFILFKNLQENNDFLRVGRVRFSENNNSEEKQHRFVNALGIGFDAIVAHYNQQNKTLSGVLSYITAIIKALRNYEPIVFECVLDEINRFSGKKLLVTVGKGKTSGGGFYLTPKAELFDESFEICAIEFVKKFKLMRSLPKALINKLDTLKEASFHKSSNISLQLGKPTFVHTDGEIISNSATNVKVDLLKSNIRLINNH